MHIKVKMKQLMVLAVGKLHPVIFDTHNLLCLCLLTHTQLHPSMARELFAAAFVACWSELDAVMQEQLVRRYVHEQVDLSISRACSTTSIASHGREGWPASRFGACWVPSGCRSGQTAYWPALQPLGCILKLSVHETAGRGGATAAATERLLT
jgi:hypothetical protein